MKNIDSPNFPKLPIGENDLSDKQLLAIDLLISGAKVSEIAQQLAVDRRTIYNWRQLDAFHEKLEVRRQDLISDSADEIRALIAPSIAVMREQLAQRYDRTRFRAAATILRLCGFRDVLKTKEKN